MYFILLSSDASGVARWQKVGYKFNKIVLQKTGYKYLGGGEVPVYFYRSFSVLSNSAIGVELWLPRSMECLFIQIPPQDATFLRHLCYSETDVVSYPGLHPASLPLPLFCSFCQIFLRLEAPSRRDLMFCPLLTARYTNGTVWIKIITTTSWK